MATDPSAKGEGKAKKGSKAEVLLEDDGISLKDFAPEIPAKAEWTAAEALSQGWFFVVTKDRPIFSTGVEALTVSATLVVSVSDAEVYQIVRDCHAERFSMLLNAIGLDARYFHRR